MDGSEINTQNSKRKFFDRINIAIFLRYISLACLVPINFIFLTIQLNLNLFLCGLIFASPYLFYLIGKFIIKKISLETQFIISVSVSVIMLVIGILIYFLQFFNLLILQLLLLTFTFALVTLIYINTTQVFTHFKQDKVFQWVGFLTTLVTIILWGNFLNWWQSTYPVHGFWGFVIMFVVSACLYFISGYLIKKDIANYEEQSLIVIFNKVNFSHIPKEVRMNLSKLLWVLWSFMLTTPLLWIYYYKFLSISILHITFMLALLFILYSGFQYLIKKFLVFTGSKVVLFLILSFSILEHILFYFISTGSLVLIYIMVLIQAFLFSGVNILLKVQALNAGIDKKDAIHFTRRIWALAGFSGITISTMLIHFLFVKIGVTLTTNFSFGLNTYTLALNFTGIQIYFTIVLLFKVLLLLLSKTYFEVTNNYDTVLASSIFAIPAGLLELIPFLI